MTRTSDFIPMGSKTHVNRVTISGFRPWRFLGCQHMSSDVNREQQVTLGSDTMCHTLSLVRPHRFLVAVLSPPTHTRFLAFVRIALAHACSRGEWQPRSVAPSKNVRTPMNYVQTLDRALKKGFSRKTVILFRANFYITS